MLILGCTPAAALPGGAPKPTKSPAEPKHQLVFGGLGFKGLRNFRYKVLLILVRTPAAVLPGGAPKPAESPAEPKRQLDFGGFRV